MKVLKTDNIYVQLLLCISGLFFLSFGIYMTINAEIGLAPWDVFAMGLSYKTDMTYGRALIVVSIGVIIVDVLLREKIGFGTLFDGTLVGIFVDMFVAMDLLGNPNSLIVSVISLLLGVFIIALGQCFYMSSAQGCGPRDTLLVALGKRMKKLPIGVVNTIIFVTVLIIGVLLGGPVGIGTVISTFTLGTFLQIVCKTVNFEPRAVKHKNILEAVREMRLCFK